MLDHKEFDIWSEAYDRDVVLTDEANNYPFAGYKKVLDGIYQIIVAKPQAVVLDLGFGTGILTTKLYEKGCSIYGQDFSQSMLEIAAAKMPAAHLYQGDFSQGLVEPLRNRHYDFIIATYSLHHLADEQKIELLESLSKQLTADGKILIGDVMFESRALLEHCRLEMGEEWDDEEIYFVVDEWKQALPRLSFEKMSYCSGILIYPNKNPQD